MKFLFGLLLAGSTDLALGIFLSHIMIKIYDLKDYIFLTYVYGALFAVLPDCDGIIQRVTKGKIFSEHRDWPHYPIIIIPIFFGIFIFSDFYAVLAAVCLLAHYIHDSLETAENGGGIQWLAPFYNAHYQFSVSIKKIEDGKIITRVSKRKLEKLKKSRETIEEWLEKYYLNESFNSFFGLIFFLCVLTIVLFI